MWPSSTTLPARSSLEVRAKLRARELGDQGIVADIAVDQLRRRTIEVGASLAVTLPAEHLRHFAEAPGDG